MIKREILPFDWWQNLHPVEVLRFLCAISLSLCVCVSYFHVSPDGKSPLCGSCDGVHANQLKCGLILKSFCVCALLWEREDSWDFLNTANQDESKFFFFFFWKNLLFSAVSPGQRHTWMSAGPGLSMMPNPVHSALAPNRWEADSLRLVD